MITEKARPKVNLSLKVVGRRSDGYHLLDSLVVFPDGGDLLTFENADELSLEISGDNAEGLGTPEDNLIYQVARHLKETYQVSQGAFIHLEKKLPVASGIGGGSADAAAALRGLNKLWNLNLSDQQLEQTGLQFGADIPVCISSQARYMRGIGDELSEPVDLPAFHILLINPRKSVSTPDIFKALGFPFEKQMPHPPEVSNTGSVGELAISLKGLTNDLQSAAEGLIPEITNILTFLEQSKTCLFHRMSGSGATCFGVFENEGEGEQVLRRLRENHPTWWAALMPCHQKG